jgi:hypothetical protein
MAPLSDQEIEQGPSGGEGRREGDAIVRDLKFDDVAGAMPFVDRVADAAEEATTTPTSSSTAGTRSASPRRPTPRAA